MKTTTIILMDNSQLWKNPEHFILQIYLHACSTLPHTLLSRMLWWLISMSRFIKAPFLSRILLLL